MLFLKAQYVFLGPYKKDVNEYFVFKKKSSELKFVLWVAVTFYLLLTNRQLLSFPARPTPKTRVWFQTKLHSTQFSLRSLNATERSTKLITLSCIISMDLPAGLTFFQICMVELRHKCTLTPYNNAFYSYRWKRGQGCPCSDTALPTLLCKSSSSWAN